MAVAGGIGGSLNGYARLEPSWSRSDRPQVRGSEDGDTAFAAICFSRWRETRSMIGRYCNGLLRQPLDHHLRPAVAQVGARGQDSLSTSQ